MVSAQPPNILRYAHSGHRWAGVDSAWEQKKPEARKLLENAPTPTSRVHAVLGGCGRYLTHSNLNIINLRNSIFYEI